MGSGFLVVAGQLLDDIKARCKEGDWKLAEQMTWRGSPWPSTRDLKALLDECHADADEAFRRMLGSMSGTVRAVAAAVIEAGT